MSYYIGKFFLWVLGWKISSTFSQEKVKKCIFIVAPHTSYWDFIYGRIAFWSVHLDVKFLIKKEVFTSIVGGPLRALGGVAVDRNRGNNTIHQVVDYFNTNEKFYLTVTPEGTRKYTTNWKKGFYHIAQQANVPVYMCFLNYKTKRGGISHEFIITGDYDKDFKQIEEFYSTMWAKHPKKFNLNPKQ